MGLGKRIDSVAGQLSRLLHLRAAKHNTFGDLDPYLDKSAAELFPPPAPIGNMVVKRTVVDRVIRSSTLSWKSSHEVLCPRYRERHNGEYRSNLTAWARWLRPDVRPRRECLIYVHGWLEPGAWVEEPSLFRMWTRAMDVDMVHVSLPFHGRRNPRSSLFSGEYFWTADLVRSIEGVRQAVSDVRSMMAWLLEQGYERIGVSGVSLGGAIVMMLACVEPLPDYIVPIVAHLELEDAVESAPILWRMKHDLDRWGIDRSQRREIFRRLGLSSLRPILEPHRQLWIEALEDIYINPQLVESQWRAWGHPPIHWITGGHMTFPFHALEMTREMATFLEGLH